MSLSRRRPPAQVRRLRPCRGIALRHVPAATRPLRASVVRALRRARPLAGSALCRVRRPTARVRLGPRSARLRRRRACPRRVVEGTRTPRPRGRRRRARRRRDPQAGRRRGHLRSRRSRSRAQAWTCTGGRPRGRARRCLVDPDRDPPATPAGDRSPARPAAGRAPRQRCGRLLSPRTSPPRVCLIDDVYTTGSTATACATELRRAGARRVDVVCLARAVAVVGWMRETRRREDRHATQAHRPSRQPERGHAPVRGGQVVEARSPSARSDADRGHVLARAQPVDRQRPHGRGNRACQGAESRRARVGTDLRGCDRQAARQAGTAGRALSRQAHRRDAATLAGRACCRAGRGARSSSSPASRTA